MAGLTKEIIFEAADVLLSKTGKVTNEAVLGHLGTGSMSTITRHLREWRQIQRESLPQSNDNPNDTQAEPVDDFKLDDIPAVQKAISDIQLVLFNTVSTVVSEQRSSASALQKAMQADFSAKIEQSQQFAAQQAETLNAKIFRFIEEYEDNLAAASGHIDELVEAVKERDTRLQHILAEKADVEARLSSVVEERNASKIENATLTEKLHSASEVCQRLTCQNDEQVNSITALTLSVKQLEQAEHTASAQRDSALAEIARLRPFEAEASAQRQRADISQKQARELNSEVSVLHEKVTKSAEQIVILERDYNYSNSELIKARNLVKKVQAENAVLTESVAVQSSRADKAEKAIASLQTELLEVRKSAGQDKTAYQAELQRLTKSVEAHEKTAVEAAAAHQKSLDSQRFDYGRTIEVLQSAIRNFTIAQTTLLDKGRIEPTEPAQGLAC